MSYLTNGQNVPDDIETADAQRLARLILGMEPAAAVRARRETRRPANETGGDPSMHDQANHLRELVKKCSTSADGSNRKRATMTAVRAAVALGRRLGRACCSLAKEQLVRWFFGQRMEDCTPVPRSLRERPTFGRCPGVRGTSSEVRTESQNFHRLPLTPTLSQGRGGAGIDNLQWSIYHKRRRKD